MGMTNRDPRTMFTVRYTTVDRHDRVVGRERSFRTEAAMRRWLDRDDNGVVDVLAYANPDR